MTNRTASSTGSVLVGFSGPAEVLGNGLAIVGQAIVAAHDTVARWAEARSQRRHLRGLPDYLLRDIGLSQADVYRETHKPFWRT